MSDNYTDSSSDYSYDDPFYYDEDISDTWCFVCGCDLSNTTNFIYSEKDDEFYCIECYEREIWLE